VLPRRRVNSIAAVDSWFLNDVDRAMLQGALRMGSTQTPLRRTRRGVLLRVPATANVAGSMPNGTELLDDDGARPIDVRSAPSDLNGLPAFGRRTGQFERDGLTRRGTSREDNFDVRFVQ